MTQTASPTGMSPGRGFSVRRWPSEVPLFALSCVVSIPLWILLAVSIVGIVYAIGIGVFLFVVHLAMIAHVRGSGVRLSDDQFPEVFSRVQRLAADMVRALAILASVVLPLAVVTVVGMRKLPAWLAARAKGPPVAALSPDPGEQAAAASLFADPSEPAPSAQSAPSAISPEAARAQVDADIARFTGLIEAERTAGRPLPWDARALHRLWSDRYAAQDYPSDPFDSGQPYGYDRMGDDYVLWSSGPDGESDTDDDIVFDSRVAAARHGHVPARRPGSGQSGP